jgi:hypothetical protein
VDEKGKNGVKKMNVESKYDKKNVELMMMDKGE